DYLPKTFSTRELLARLRAVIRRSILTEKQQRDGAPAPVSTGGLWIDPDARIASLDGKPLTLTPIEFDMLLALARSAGRVKSREQGHTRGGGGARRRSDDRDRDRSASGRKGRRAIPLSSIFQPGPQRGALCGRRWSDPHRRPSRRGPSGSNGDGFRSRRS